MKFLSRAWKSSLWALSFLIFLPIVNNGLAAPPLIEVAPVSAVVGYEIGIFGSGFGESQGTGQVTVAGMNATILEWRDQMIRAIIPPVASGKTNLVVTAGGEGAAWPIAIYTIDPKFTTRVNDMQNMALGKAVYFTEPTANIYIGDSPSLTLSRNDADSPGYLYCSAGQILAVNLGQPMNEEVWWTMYGGTDGWPPFDQSGRAMTYTIEASNNSTNGVDGTWQVLHSVAYSERVSVVHKVKLTNQSWIRMKVSATLNNGAFRVFEVRVHRRDRRNLSGRIDSLGIIGDSLTFSDLSPLRSDVFFPAILAQKRGTTTEIVHYPVGLVAAQASTLSATNPEEWALRRILQQMTDIDFWGFAFGTNDSLSIWDTQNYKQYVREGIEQVLARGKVPLLARLPDTGPEGFGSSENKIAILRAIDELNAEYRLIPGPDLYTPFRKNILYEGMTYLNDDQTHHSGEGGLVVQQLWAEALIKAGIYTGPAPAMTPAAPTETMDAIEGEEPSRAGNWRLHYRYHLPR